MVLGPDLVGWKLTEARVWAMLRDEEALQVEHAHNLSTVASCFLEFICSTTLRVRIPEHNPYPAYPVC